MCLTERLARRRPWAFAVAIACGAGFVSGTACAATYHVDATSGSDKATGLSPDEAWRTLGHVNEFRLKAGDTVLFRRGDAWSGQLEIASSGRTGAPITFGAYGSGARPVFERGAHGIVSQNQRSIEIRDLHIRDTGLGGVWVKGGDGWRFENMVIERTGRRKGEGGIAWWHGSDLTISGSVLTDVAGDGIWAWQSDGLRLLNNRIGVVQGPNADNAHLQRVRNFEIRGNVLSMEGPTDSGKGNLLLGQSDGGVVANNTFIAGNFGIGLDASNTVIEANHFINHNSASWSAALNMGSGRSSNLIIRNNYFDGSRVGLSLFELTGKWADAPVVRANMVVSRNIFNVRQHAMTIQGPVQYSGGFTGNTVIGPPARDWNRMGGRTSGGWTESGTKFARVPPPWTGGASCGAAANDVRDGNAASAKHAGSGSADKAPESCPKL
jgi:hypothetical protein